MRHRPQRPLRLHRPARRLAALPRAPLSAATQPTPRPAGAPSCCASSSATTSRAAGATCATGRWPRCGGRAGDAAGTAAGVAPLHAAAVAAHPGRRTIARNRCRRAAPGARIRPAGGLASGGDRGCLQRPDCGAAGVHSGAWPVARTPGSGPASAACTRARRGAADAGQWGVRHRPAAARVPIVRSDHLTPDGVRRYNRFNKAFGKDVLAYGI